MEDNKKKMNIPEIAFPIQMVGRLNDIHRLDKVGPGNAFHRYQIHRNEIDPETGGMLCIQEIIFQKGPRDEEGSTPGVLENDLLEIVRDRLRCFQAGPYACRENALVLTHIEQAIMWNSQRAHNRAARNVLGTYEK